MNTNMSRLRITAAILLFIALLVVCLYMLHAITYDVAYILLLVIIAIGYPLLAVIN